MRKVFVGLMLLILCFSLKAQLLRDSKQFANLYDPQKNESQKTWATILTVGGAALVISGAVMYGYEADYFSGKGVGTAMMVGGGIAIGGGIILYRAASRNKNMAEAMSMRLNLAVETTAISQKEVIRKACYPALGLNIRW